jgi:hypothetical protein
VCPTAKTAAEAILGTRLYIKVQNAVIFYAFWTAKEKLFLEGSR